MGYNRSAPFLAKIVSRHRLNKAGSSKETWHVSLDISGSGIHYRPGDSFGICPENDPHLVHSILEACHFEGSEEVFDERSQRHFSIREWLAKRANLAVCSKKFLQSLSVHHPDPQKKEEFECLIAPGSEESLQAFLALWNVPEVIAMHPQVKWQPIHFVQTLQPLLPRLYSIASTQEVSRDRVDFTISRVRYEIEGRKRFGICSHFLCDMVAEGEGCVPVYLQPTKDFLLPEDHSTPIIMVGPGTGIAPFRAFMQEREHRTHSLQKNWLFFGEREKVFDFFYEEFWRELVASNTLRLDVAFSRDQPEKVYVQHKLWQERKEIWQWLQDGAKIYVCGDASRMAKDLDNCLQEILTDQAQMSREEARGFLGKLRKEKRYLRDVY